MNEEGFVVKTDNYYLVNGRVEYLAVELVV